MVRTRWVKENSEESRKPKNTKTANIANTPRVGQKVLNPPNSPCKYAVAEAADTTAVAVS